MDRTQLIELITNEVLNVVKEDGLKPLSSESSVSSYEAMDTRYARPLMLVCGNPLNSDWAVDFFRSFKERYNQTRVVMSHGAKFSFHNSKRPFAGFALREDDGDFDEQVDSYDSLVVVNTSVNTVSKLAALIADTVASIVVFRFLSAKKPVTLLIDGLDKWYFNDAVRNKVQSDLARIRDYGICVCEAGSSQLTKAHGALGNCSPDNCEACGLCFTRAADRVGIIIAAGADRISQGPGTQAGGDVARFIDHTLLKADATDDEVRVLCREARTYNFASVCVNPSKVKLAAEMLAGCPSMVCTVVGFPLGATTAATKAAETRDAIANGADEIDMVINVGALKAKDYETVQKDIEAVVAAAGGKTTKVILETSLLTQEEKVQACILAKNAHATFVKTSTGFGGGGATAEDIALMRKTVGPTMGVKASGGVRDLDTARKMLQSGATRIGASASVEIVLGKAGASSY
jgi:deoxyribose-phosphate aldolase